jgi:hypothetical protein
MRRSREVYTGGASRGVDHNRCAKLTPAARIKDNPLAAGEQGSED